MSWPVVHPPWKHAQWNQTSPIQGNPVLDRGIVLPFPEMNSILFRFKKEIELLDTIGEWEYLKKCSNPYELVFSQSQDSRIPYSVSSIRPLSRSFFKMVEILSVLDFFSSKRSIQSAHVCEGPGGFIEALLNISEKNGCRLENAWAMTLRPSKPNIPGWKRAYTFLKKSPMVQIEYGADATGDILVPQNQDVFLEKTRGKCDIFTADGGFDFSEHYGTQEEEVFPLLVSSALIGLQTLRIGGDFVLKVFDTELKSTRDLIAILATCFDRWTLYKPSLSRPCNAEKYFLGSKCRSIPPWIIKILTEMRDTYRKGFMYVRSIYPSLPLTIMNDIDDLKKRYLDQQIHALDYALSHNDEWSGSEKVWKTIQEHSLQWCREFSIPVKGGLV